MISYGKQTITERDIQSVIDILKSDWLTQGPQVQLFESDLAEFYNSRYCSVVANGTAALHLVSLALGWNKDDIILTTPITFVATANSIIYTGATPDFVDIDPISYNIDIIQLKNKIDNYQKVGKKIKAVIAVDFAGNPCDWAGLRELADIYKFKLINDNCHALGAEYNLEKHYAVKYADAVIQSFHPVKHITTGEGGAIITNDPEIDEKIKLLRTHGITKESEKLIKNDGPWYYEMKELGYNYRITDFQCALGRSQLSKINEFLAKRRSLAKKYDIAFSDNNFISTPIVEKNSSHAYHLYPVRIYFDNLSLDKKTFFTKMYENDIILQVHYIPVHTQPFYAKSFGFKQGDFPVAELFYREEVSLPIYPSLSAKDQDKVINIILENIL